MAKRPSRTADVTPVPKGASHQCFHCKEWIPTGTAHDCWTTTERALTKDLPDDLREAWERLRETAAEFGDQRIYASHSCIMFSRQACYFFVRPKMKRLEVCVFLGRTVKAPQVRKAMPSSRTKVAHIVHVTHRDEVEPPLTDWLKEAYEVSPRLGRSAGARKRAEAMRTSRSPKASLKPTS
jgi:hypothetical protein